MEINNKLKEIKLKILRYYFDGIIKFEGFDLDKILKDEKSYKYLLLYNISYKTLIGNKLLLIRFDKKDKFFRVYDGTRYLLLFGAEKFDFIYDRIRYLIRIKNSNDYVISHNYAKVKVDSYDSLPLKKTLTLHNVIIVFKLVFIKNQNHCYYNIFLKKCSYQLPKNDDNQYVFV